MMRLLCCLVALVALVPGEGSGASAKDGKAYYIQPSQVDLDYLLQPPPELGSPAETADLAAVVNAEKDRSANDVVAAEADYERSVFRFEDVMGARFTPSNLPFSTMFFGRVYSDERKIVAEAKAHFKRLRPFLVDSRLTAVIRPRPTPSYPSGHATFAYVNAILLARMVPEKAPAIFARAADYAWNRVIVGAHFPTDAEAGRIAGSIIDSVLFHQLRFMSDFRRAQKETRRALGLPPESGVSPANHREREREGGRQGAYRPRKYSG